MKTECDNAGLGGGPFFNPSVTDPVPFAVVVGICAVSAAKKRQMKAPRVLPWNAEFDFQVLDPVLRAV